MRVVPCCVVDASIDEHGREGVRTSRKSLGCGAPSEAACTDRAKLNSLGYEYSINSKNLTKK